MKRGVHRWITWLILIMAGMAIGFTGLLWSINEVLPTGHSPLAADVLANQIQQAVAIDAWYRTGAIRWTFAGLRRYLWDRSG